MTTNYFFIDRTVVPSGGVTEVNVSVPSSSVDPNNGTYKHLFCFASLASDRSSSRRCDLSFRFNGDFGTNTYKWNNSNQRNAFTTASRAVYGAQSNQYIQDLPCTGHANIHEDHRMYMRIYVPQAWSTSIQKVMFHENGSTQVESGSGGAASDVWTSGLGTSRYYMTAKVTSLDFIAESGDIVEGSTFDLYGISVN